MPGRVGPSTAWASLRHRAGASVMLVVLSAVAIAAAAAGPLYQSSVETAAVRTVLQQAPIAQRGLTISTSSPAEAERAVPTGHQRRLFGPAVSGAETDLAPRVNPATVVAPLVSRDGVCAHLRVVSGRCPTAAGEVIVPQSAAARLGARVGGQASFGPAGAQQALTLPLTVVGTYRVRDAGDAFWSGRRYFAATDAGVVFRDVDTGGMKPDVLHVEAMFVDAAGMTAVQRAYQAAGISSSSPVRSALDLPLVIDRVGANDLPTLSAAVQHVRDRLAAQHPNPGDDQRGTVSTSLPRLVSQAAVGRGQTRVIIPALAAELALAVLLVVGLVLAAAVDQRRGELALVRLRGGSRSRGARMVSAEVAVAAVLAVVPGFALGWFVSWIAARAFLPAGVPVLPGWPAGVAALAVVVVEIVIAAVLARRAAGRPVTELLRQIPPRHHRRAVGAAEAAVAVAAAGAVIAVLGGDRRSPLALVAPGLVALFAGLVLARVVPAVAGARGRSAWWRGRVATGLAGLRTARTADVRRVVVLVCVAVALVVGAADLWQTAGAERHARAAVETGAAVRLGIDTPDVSRVRRAVQQADAAGTYAATAVVADPGGDATRVLAVDTARWTRVAQWGHERDRPSADMLRALRPTASAPVITARGDRLTVRYGPVQVRRQDTAVGPLSLRFTFRLDDGSRTTTTVAVGASGSTASAVLGCTSGCRLFRVELLRAAGDFAAADVSIGLADVRVGAATLLLGTTGQWGDVSTTQAANAADRAALTVTGGVSTLTVSSHGAPASVQHLDVPLVVPCLAAGSLAGAARRGQLLSVRGLDGQAMVCRGIGAVPLVPYLGREGVLLDLDGALAGAGRLSGTTTSVWLADAEPGPERGLDRALSTAGVEVADRSTLSDRQRRYDQAPPAWALQVALLTGGGAALVAALLVVVVALGSRRSRGHDLAALRLVGVPARRLRQSVRREQFGALVLASVTGALLGVAGARLSLPSVPLFVSAATAPRPQLAVSWLTSALAGVAALAVLLVAGAAAVRLVVARVSGPSRRRRR